jgi:hypothetical protein
LETRSSELALLVRSPCTEFAAKVCANMPPILRNVGTTQSERHLAKLADRTFLNLWSYPNLNNDNRMHGRGDGKELCDLLVICGDHVLIFSDRSIGWSTASDIAVAWRRWFKAAVRKSVDQVRGAARWIDRCPDNVFLDKQCTQRLPLPLPPREQRKLHGIVVALGAGEACKQHFGQGIGSLLIAPNIKGDDHIREDGVYPFAIGDVNPDGFFMHVFDDATLDIVMHELDTVTDLTGYLTKKESFVRSGRLYAASGEEELVAYYLTHANKAGEHDFTHDDGSPFLEGEALVLDPGLYSNLSSNPRYIAKKDADWNSYLWDTLIEKFTANMLAGTSSDSYGRPFVLSEHEQGVRHMALEPRLRRRRYGEGIADALGKHLEPNEHFFRAFIPADRETGFFFLTVPMPSPPPEGGYA